MNNSKSSAGTTASNTNEKKVFVTDPFPIIKYLNMALAAGMLIFALFNILSIFKLASYEIRKVVISFSFSIYQM